MCCFASRIELYIESSASLPEKNVSTLLFFPTTLLLPLRFRKISFLNLCSSAGTLSGLSLKSFICLWLINLLSLSSLTPFLLYILVLRKFCPKNRYRNSPIYGRNRMTTIQERDLTGSSLLYIMLAEKITARR